MAAKLIEPGEGAERTRDFPIHGEEFLIGRGTDCDLRLPASEISRHHCLLRVRKGEATISDLGSSNGTFVNGKPIRSAVSVRSGDEIRLGPFRFLLDLGDVPEGILQTSAEVDPAAPTQKLKETEVRGKG
jgi:pSer/pThr/pTyr-binding forkhead associated (FHA) protein